MRYTIILEQEDGFRYEKEIDIPEGDIDLVESIVEDVVDVIALLMSKRADYGSDNIAMTGPTGIAVRLVDKSARLWHLQATGSIPHHESTADTYRDIVGYALMGMALEKGNQW